ncbi:Rv2231c family pyridoxal phosphate-dependent protein CobC [Nocardia nova]|uniref:Rv2231c family pyridoxal phosphate-dependent protein CobC n=1 Tax=Nocardia nova TaxID=37330 RepID=UPI0033EE404C
MSDHTTMPAAAPMSRAVGTGSAPAEGAPVPSSAGRPVRGEAAESRDGGAGPGTAAADIGDAGRAALRHHGDVEVRPGMLDFAVNVQDSAPPEWLRRRLADRLGDLGRYPSESEAEAVRATVAARHGRTAGEVLLLAGAAEGFAMLPRLASTLAAVIHPSFTEPELALREAGIPVTRVMLDSPYELAAARVPEAADLVVLGNPTNPTSVLHPRASIEALRRPGRIVVVDEAFADAVPGEPESLAGQSYPDVVVLRSLTKTWALAGLRCGYLLGPAPILARLNHGRAHWAIGTLQLEAIAATSEPAAIAQAEAAAHRIAADREAMIPRLRALGVEVCEPAAGPFLLIRVPDAELLRKRLAGKDIAVRRGDTFPGLDNRFLRLAVRGPEAVDRLVAAIGAAGL